MLESSSSITSATYPRVRDACESCHRRKIRCLLTPGSPACQSCLSSGDSCLFAPRAKAGRPRRTHSENHQRRKLSWQAAEKKGSRTSNESGHARSSSDSLVMVAGEELQFGAIMAFDNYWDPDEMTDMQELGDVDFFTDNITPQERRKPPMALNGAQQDTTHKDGALGLLTPSHSSTAQYDIFASEDESLDFDTALKLCGDLDRSYRTLRDRQVDAIEVKGIMKMVEYACTTARIAASSVSAEKASTALILAVVYKVLEICEILIRQIVDDGSKADSLDRSFRLQRLDLALFQGFMFLNHTSQVDALKKVSELHTWISSIMQQQQYQSIW